MTLGEKIKEARKSLKMTQSRLAGDKITRNMISRIESGSASPSLETIKYIADRLSLPVSYFLSESEDILFYEKNEWMKRIYEAFSKGDYAFCINKISSFSGVDNELAYIAAISCFELGRDAFMRGSLKTAVMHFESSEAFSSKTVFDLRTIGALIEMYKSVAMNIQAPLLEFNDEKYIESLNSTYDFEMYKYLTQDHNFEYTTPCFALHCKAKKKIKERKYQEAIAPLLEAAQAAFTGEYNSFAAFSIYTDLEQCYKQLYDFENAYRYSSKRMSMLEGFKT